MESSHFCHIVRLRSKYEIGEWVGVSRDNSVSRQKCKRFSFARGYTIGEVPVSYA